MEIFKIYKTLHLNQISPYYPRNEAYTGLAFVPEIGTKKKIQKKDTKNRYKKKYPQIIMSTNNSSTYIKILGVIN